MPRFALTIQCDTAAELAAVVTYLDTMPAARSSPREPGDDEPPPPKPHPPRPSQGRDTTPIVQTGKQLYGWAREHEGSMREINRLGKARGYPARMVDWAPEMVADVFYEVAQPRGQWGGAS